MSGLVFKGCNVAKGFAELLLRSLVGRAYRRLIFFPGKGKEQPFDRCGAKVPGSAARASDL